MAYTLIMDAVSTCITTSRDTILTTRMSTYAAAPPPGSSEQKKPVVCSIQNSAQPYGFIRRTFVTPLTHLPYAPDSYLLYSSSTVP